MNLDSAKAIWDYLKKEYQGNERTKNMQSLNLIREFEMLKMKDSETIKEYFEKLMGIANKVRLLGKDFSDERVVQKILVTLREKYESKISSLEESKDLSSISLAELVNALQAQEQRRLIREEGIVEGALRAESKIDNKFRKYPTCPYFQKTNHAHTICWWRPEVQCKKCGQIEHMENVCTTQNQDAKANIATNRFQEEELF